MVSSGASPLGLLLHVTPHKDLSPVHVSVSCSLFYKDTSQIRWEPTLLCCAQLCPTPCDHLSPTRFLCPWDFFRQAHWSGSPFSTPNDLLNPGIKPGPLASPALAGRLFYYCATWEARTHSGDLILMYLPIWRCISKYSHLVWYCGMKTLIKNWGGDTVHPITAHTFFFFF